MKLQKLIRFYAPFSVAVLASSTIYWAILGARVQQHNADQLVNALLFENAATFRDSLFPGSHTFFIKWPLFLFERLFGLGDGAYIAVTVGTVLATVGALAYLLYRIERRPLVFGTICLALSSVLMLIPIESAPGALLPVNMAMLATRNLEYILFILAILLVLRAGSLRQPRAWMGLGLLSLLVASDKLYLSLALGSSAAGVAIFWAFRQKQQNRSMLRWLVVSMLSFVVSTLVIKFLSIFTNVAGSDKASPYQLAGSAHDIVLGTVYGLLHILTNFGANPAGQELVLQNVPGKFIGGILSISGLSYIVNIGLLLFCLWAVYKVLWEQIWTTRNTTDKDAYGLLAVAMVLAAATALGAFVVTKHYYAGDARYVAISFFAMAIAGTVYTRGRDFSQRTLLIAGAVCMLSTLLAIPTTQVQADRSQEVYSTYAERNSRIGHSMASLQRAKSGQKAVLVGDYWRVVPIKQKYTGLVVTPLSGCTTERDVLSSSQWQPDLDKTSFAYLLSLDTSLTDYPRCTLDEVIQAYGTPNDTQLIDGSRENPKELLLIYDKATDKDAEGLL